MKLIWKRSIVMVAGLVLAQALSVEAGIMNLKLDGLATGNHDFTADGETFSGYVRNDSGTGWLLVGRGRNGWEFDNDGQGAVSDVGNAGVLGTTAAFSPVMYRDAIINDLLTNSGIDLTDVEIRIRRATDVDGTGTYQEALWRPISQTTWTGDFDAPENNPSGGYDVEFEIVSGPGSTLGPSNAKTGDTFNNGPSGNNNTRIFTWPWGGHNNSQGFSYGQNVQGTNNNSPTTFLWENSTEGHAIPYTEVYIRSTVAVIPEPVSFAVGLIGLGALVARRRR